MNTEYSLELINNMPTRDWASIELIWNFHLPPWNWTSEKRASQTGRDSQNSRN